MDIIRFREVIKQREETDDEWTFGVEQCWKKEIEILAEDIPSTINFLKNDCTAEEYSWISEVIDDVVEKVRSKELVQCYKDLMIKFPEECVKYNIAGSIESAEAILTWEDENEKKVENLVDEGFRIGLVETAFFDGKFEIPHIDAPKEIIIPKGMIPFSIRERSIDKSDFVCFYEHDKNFREILTDTEDFVDDLKRYPGVISPDCSLYIDAPLCVQIADIYLNRAVGYYLSQQGIYVILNIRWGDERTYTDALLGEKVAFQGVDKHSIVSVGTYGQIQTAESKRYFREGLIAMLDELEPQVVLVYGSMPNQIFGGLSDRTKFVQFPDWTTRMKTTK